MLFHELVKSTSSVEDVKPLVHNFTTSPNYVKCSAKLPNKGMYGLDND